MLGANIKSSVIKEQNWALAAKAKLVQA